MSMAKFPPRSESYEIEDSLSQILTSIAMEELGLSHIINAEGEKIQYVLGTLEEANNAVEPSSIAEIIEVNESVKDMLEKISLNQIFLFAKMSTALNAYFKAANDSANNGNGNNGGNGGEEDGTTIGVDGETLEGGKVGDSSDWIEIAQNGDFSLIIRKNFINTYTQANNYGDPFWQRVIFGTNNNYATSYLRNKINEWFRGIAPAAADNLPADAVLRDYTVQNTALAAIGSGPVPAGINDGISKPIDQHDGVGYDVAFALSYGEAANFISLEYAWDGGVNTPSNSIAQSNFAKITIPSDVAGYDGIWLRSPGNNSNYASNLWKTGRVFQMGINDLSLVYPALWVYSNIFEIT